ncbi:MAG: VWA domain-containing protein [Candidatus Eisenbacteria bacterium]|nr:VWA domain-containing protein [Candidatus Eisenbacteria bacterium]
MSRIRRTLHWRGQRGAVIVLVAALMVVLVGAVALVVDVGMVMAYRAQLQKATDASALAAAQDLPNTSDATDTFNDYMARNLPEAEAVTAPEVTLTFLGNPVGTMKVESTQEVSLWFARVLGKQSTTIRAVSAAQRVGADLMLVLDRSGSMCNDHPGQPCPYCPSECAWEPMTSVKNAGVYLVNQLADETMMGVVSYNTYLSCDVRLKYLKNEAAAVVAGIQRLEPGRGTSIYTDIGGGMRMATDSLATSGRPNPKIVVLITDGLANVIKGRYYDRLSPCVFDSRPLNWVVTQANYAKEKHVIVYAVVFGEDKDPRCPSGQLIYHIGEPLMKQVVQITGGVYFRAVTTDDLYPIFHEIAGYDFVRLIPAP